VRAMINLDMVGRVKDNKLTISGCKTATQFDSLVTVANKDIGLDVTCKGDGYGPSDHMSFFMADKPVLFFFSGVHEDYHKSTDTADKINYKDMARVVHLTDNLMHAIDGYAPALAFVKTAEAPKEGGGRLRSSLGSVPDFSQPDSLKGYLIGDAKPNGAAANAGLTKGDLVIRMGKVSIGNIYDLMNALRIYAPGDTVDITYLRGKDEKQATAVLGTSSR
jgi:C-terminal processing protease CtpA/Prc